MTEDQGLRLPRGQNTLLKLFIAKDSSLSMENVDDPNSVELTVKSAADVTRLDSPDRALNGSHVTRCNFRADWLFGEYSAAIPANHFSRHAKEL
ncbi:hypothetical protein PoB_004328900 [Plakobranchus ocellatus]|uniref:Uncharacterized protein n=1 Tax=Plakobranchus ocellatus TaxID=259542 RepID=A0AAV4BEJ6_9GAST|nr:hypothetical protein PoB_004328900 [Plakobranchus ocellatus]